MPGNIIIWDMCTINDNQMMYVSWDIEPYRHNFLSFWPDFWLSIPPNTPQKKNFKKIKKKKKKRLEILSVYMCAIYDNHMMYRCWDMEHDWQFFVILDHFFALLPPNNPKNQHFEKNEKNHLDAWL